jgi:hypothetical protein
MLNTKHPFKSEPLATSQSVSVWARARVWTFWSWSSSTKAVRDATGHGPYFGVLVLRDNGSRDSDGQ